MKDLKAIQTYIIDFRPFLLTQKVEKIQRKLNEQENDTLA